MAKARGRKSSKKSSARNGQERMPAAPMAGSEPPSNGLNAPGTTGRYLVLMREDAVDAGVSALKKGSGIRTERASEFEGKVRSQGLSSGEAMLFEELGVALVDSPPDQIRSVSAAEESGILAVEPERVVYALEAPTYPREPGSLGVRSTQFEYVRGYRDAVNHMADQILGVPSELARDGAIAAGITEDEVTWGLLLTRVAASHFTGRGTRVAVLDTGLDLGHPDFTGRSIEAQSFMTNEPVQDQHGHGTHCIGTACGPLEPRQPPRYGIAHECEIFAGKVLSNRGSGTDGSILAGMDWAVRHRCHVVSMSLGAAVLPGGGHSHVFERVAQRALKQGTLIVAAAGNDSERPGLISPVSHPANCPSIVAVGAMDIMLRIAPFSNGGLNPQGGQVDIAGPGVAVHSSWPRPILYRTIGGTSMATPHVAGIAALLAEANPEARGRALQGLLTQTARRLSLPARDVGAGLVQAP